MLRKAGFKFYFCHLQEYDPGHIIYSLSNSALLCINWDHNAYLLGCLWTSDQDSAREGLTTVLSKWFLTCGPSMLGVHIWTLGFPWNSWLDSGWTKWAKINWSETLSWEFGGRDMRVYGFTYCLTCEFKGRWTRKPGTAISCGFAEMEIQ